ncbi:MAG: hypothetical protein KJP07_13595 [Desulfatitalea sp.]|nr:hypothetical protein [Desulfatitalea sp.]
MATKLYREDQETGVIVVDWFDGSEVGNLIANGGWSVCPPGDTPAQADTMDELSNEEIREIAKLAGIEEHNKKRINTLKDEIKAMEA